MDSVDRRDFLLGLGAGGLVLAAGPAAAQATPAQGGTFSIGLQDSLDTLDPTFSIQFAERRILHLVYNTLVSIGTDFSVKPELAASWEIENDGLRYVFHLQDGVSFHDGTPFDAEAVKFNIEHRLDESVGSPQRSRLDPVIDSVEVIDPLTVAINLKTAYPGLLGDFADRAGFMISPAAVAKFGEDFGSNPVGTGAFTLTEWVRGTSVTLDRNPDYWEDGAPYLDRIVFQTIPNTIIGLQRLRVGELDYVDNLSPDDLRQIEGNDEIKTEAFPVGLWYSLQWQVDKAPFDDLKLRQAVAHALDRDRINQIMMNGQANVANSPTPPGLWWSTDAPYPYPYDPEKARALLAEAGLEGGALTLTTPSTPIYRRLNQLVAEQLGEVGLSVTLEPVESSQWYSRVVSKAVNFTPMSWSQRADPDGLFYILFSSKGHANTTGYNNPEVDALLDEARNLLSPEERKPLYTEAAELIVHDLPYVPLFFSASFAAMSQAVDGVILTPDSIPRFRYVSKSA
ncbi:ABC transporter substrate-binding protein [Salipiger sp. P9]|uniref:ABC transporter substrate-binding protein n=1 Tax=Salipiger pentaromativorans TaxID=2943193 RepID=UPI0021587FEC|nr:ABC transporter substrate-binding protein [Salipiger pentaromativorans]MCR8549232.1 ABC transporter substrate-binding protein [Salipiger pentaromativorans]